MGKSFSQLSSIGSKYVVDFRPKDPECKFYLEWRALTPEQRAELMSDCLDARRRLDIAKFNRTLVTRCVVGWGGLTAEEFVRLELMPDVAIDALQEELAGESEFAFTKARAVDLMMNSDPFSERVNDLSTELELVEDARRAWKKKASALMSEPGTSGDK